MKKKLVTCGLTVPDGYKKLEAQRDDWLDGTHPTNGWCVDKTGNIFLASGGGYVKINGDEDGGVHVFALGDNVKNALVRPLPSGSEFTLTRGVP